MSGRLEGKNCIISGATGIAAATAELAAAEGAALFIVSLVEEDCRALADKLRSGGAVCEYAAADLTSAAAVERAVESAAGRFERLDLLFNVAGMSGRRFGDGPLHECSEAGWDKTLAVNLKTMFLLTREVLKRMLVQELSSAGLRGSILNMGSVTAFSPEPEHFATHAYAAAKGAVESLTVTTASYYAPRKIRINAIAPGLVRTPMSKRAQLDDSILRLMKSKQPLPGTILKPVEVARAALFLLSDESRHITGQTLTIDGGWRIS
jgi:NAD(P)-dependent dehydrogenase (short-subunit alcohol dehydrogenase family)